MEGKLVSFICSLSPPLCSPVLEPSLDLRIRHLEVLCEGGTLRRRKVLLLMEALLKFADLE